MPHEVAVSIRWNLCSETEHIKGRSWHTIAGVIILCCSGYHPGGSDGEESA